jgi:hypothetical protein
MAQTPARPWRIDRHFDGTGYRFLNSYIRFNSFADAFYCLVGLMLVVVSFALSRPRWVRIAERISGIALLVTGALGFLLLFDKSLSRAMWRILEDFHMLLAGIAVGSLVTCGLSGEFKFLKRRP